MLDASGRATKMSTPSPNDTVITPGVGEITDGSGDVFTVTSGGTVDMNGRPLGYTADVIAGAFVNGHFWQENSSYLWWEYTGNPSSPWTGLGTGRSPSNTFIMNGGTINLAHGIETLQLVGNDINQINLNGGVILNLTYGPSNVGPFMNLNVNASGAIVNSNLILGYLDANSINVAAGKSLILTGTLDDQGSLGITGGNGTLIDDGNISVAFAQIDSNVLGTGTMTFTYTHDGDFGRADISGASGGGLTYDVQGAPMTVEHPNTFMSKVELWDETSVTLAGLAATSYDLRGDFLTLYQGNTPVYHLNITDRSPDGLPIYVTSGTGGVTVGVPVRAFSGPPSDTLPQHTAGA
jgi:hypothetical protein